MKVSALKKKKGFTLIELMVVIAILATLAAIGSGPILDHLNDGDRQMASSNLKSLHTMLQQFKTDNGSFPCDATAETLQENKPDYNFGELKGNTSNAYYRQLFYDSRNVSEKPFFAKINCNGKMVSANGDDKIANGAALGRGENGMGYVLMNGDEGMIGVDKSNAPLAICGVYPTATPYNGTKVDFDMKSFRGHVFVLTVDGSVNDIQGSLSEDDEDEEKGHLSEGKEIFPETRKGKATADKYSVLAPEL